VVDAIGRVDLSVRGDTRAHVSHICRSAGTVVVLVENCESVEVSVAEDLRCNGTFISNAKEKVKLAS